MGNACNSMYGAQIQRKEATGKTCIYSSENDIKTDLKEAQRNRVNWTHVARDREQQ
jgi:hypothetical protein